MSKTILFITGTRADFGKIKPLIQRLDDSDSFERTLFVTGMHTMSRYGYTVVEIYKSLNEKLLPTGSRNIYTFMNQIAGQPMEQILANTINGISSYVHEFVPDMIVVHGDRVEAMAGAIVGSLRNILVAHIEGGELSGTVDDLIRHSITKLAHIHFVANEEAAARLKQLGENQNSIFIIGSPDIDIMLSPELPSIEKVKDYYEIPFEEYGCVLFHPVTSDSEETALAVKAMVSALLNSPYSYVVIYPNNDEGCELIFSEYERLKNNPRFVVFPSLRMEYFLTLLKNCLFIIGNSSAGIREAPVYGVCSINITSRQMNRFNSKSIINVEGEVGALGKIIAETKHRTSCKPCYHFGQGNSADLFMTAIKDPKLWSIFTQKQFVDI